MWKHVLLSIVCSVTFLSCDNELHMLFPEGPAGKSAYEVWVEEVLNGTIDWPEDRTDVNNFFLYLKGEDGKNGADGQSAYELWLAEVEKGLENPHNPGHEWPKDQTDMNDFWYYLSGADGQNGVTPNIGDNGNWWIGGEDTGIPAKGKDGADGQDGATPVIGENGNWWIGGVDTGVPATGADGEDGATPEIGENGNWWIDGEDTGIPAKGQDGKPGDDGVTPHIGENGNWWIDGVDTGVPAKGQDGKPGDDGQMPDITIGENGNWYINGEDTGVPAQGKDGNNGDDGQPGANGQSAYELWVEEVKAGRVYKNGELWPTTRTTVADFWEFLRGNDGADGEPGQDGQDGATIVLGAPNVIIQYYGDPDLKEYVDWEDGSVTYKIYDASGKVAEAGTQVKGIPDSKSVYTVDDEGFITVPKGDLPKDKAYENIAVEVKIDGEADFKSSATNTIVPAKMQVRLVINEEKTPTVGLFGTGEDQAKPCVNLWFKVQRKKLNTSGSGSWEGIPTALGNTQKTVKIYEYKDGVSNPTTVATHTQIEVADDGTGHNYGNCRVQIKRKFIYTDLKYLDKTKVADSDDYWGEYSAGAFRYARIGIEGCYGEAIMLQSYIKLLPAQFTPTISEMTRSELYGDGSTGGVDDLVNLTGTLDVSKVKKELFLASEYKKASKVGGLDVYEPVVGKIDEAGEIFKINFSSSTTSTNIIQSKVTIDGAFTARAVNYQSTVDLTNNSLANFYNLSLGNISGASGTLYLRVNGTYVTAPAGSENGIEIKVSSN